MAAHQESVFEGRTLDDAVRKGLEALGLSRAEVMITVMEEGSSGFLGLGSRPYRVRVMPRPGGPPREPAERGGRDRRRGGQGRGGRSEGRGRGPEGGGRVRREGARAEGRREGGRGGRGGGRDGGHREAHAGRGERDESRTEPREPNGLRGGLAPGSAQGSAAMDGAERRGRGRRGRRGRGRGDGDVRPRPDAVVRPRPEEMGEAMGSTGDTGFSPAFERVAPSDAEGGGHRDVAAGPARGDRDRDRERRPRREERTARAEGGAPSEPGMSGAELEDKGTRITQELLSAMGFTAKVSARADGENVDVIAEVAEDEDLLTGRKGEIRQALQHLLNLTINRGGGMRYHLQLEINEFWRRREAELQEQARAMADEAVTASREVITEYLNAQERRVIHVALRDDQRVKTYAIGDGLIKKLAVAPAGRPEAVRADD